MKLSDRLENVLAMASSAKVVADVGTDHAYIPIAMVERNMIDHAIAMDLRQGPLLLAQEHIKQHGLSEKIQTRLSDGVDELAVGEADTIIIAGMGGEVIIHILQQGNEVCKNSNVLVLQPQSEIDKVRKYLRENDFCICNETMVYEEKKYYTIMLVMPQTCVKEEQRETHFWGTNDELILSDMFGPCLLERKDPILRQYLEWRRNLCYKVKKQLTDCIPNINVENRIVEIKREIKYIEDAINIIN